MQMEMNREWQIGLEPETAGGRLKTVEPFKRHAIGRQQHTPRVHEAVALQVSVVTGGENGDAILIAELGGDEIGSTDRQTADDGLELFVADQPG